MGPRFFVGDGLGSNVEYEVLLFEADDRLGGHAHTHDVPSTHGGTIRIPERTSDDRAKQGTKKRARRLMLSSHLAGKP